MWFPIFHVHLLPNAVKVEPTLMTIAAVVWFVPNPSCDPAAAVAPMAVAVANAPKAWPVSRLAVMISL